MAGTTVEVDVTVDASALRRELSEAERLSRGFGRALGDALESGIVKGNSLGDVLRSLGARLSEIALSAALRPLENAFGSLLSGLTKGALGGLSPFSAGGLTAPAAFGSTAFSPAASPTTAPMTGGASVAPVTVNISTPDAESFRRSEAQVTAALARAVARGRRGM